MCSPAHELVTRLEEGVGVDVPAGPDASLLGVRVEVLGLGPGLGKPGSFHAGPRGTPRSLHLNSFCASSSQEKAHSPRLCLSVLTMRRKASDSVNISISLCWEVGIQFTV